MTDVTEMVAAPGASIRVRSSGTGPVLVLLPRLGRPAEDLDPLAARLVQAGYHVVQPDPRAAAAAASARWTGCPCTTWPQTWRR